VVRQPWVLSPEPPYDVADRLLGENRGGEDPTGDDQT
jgi:hypothetical protein